MPRKTKSLEPTDLPGGVGGFFDADTLASFHYEDPDKTFVMSTVANLVRAGRASCREVDDGELELTFLTGEIFHLGEDAVLRIN